MKVLARHRVRFLIIGAHALAAHGAPRFTGDLDVWVDPTDPNARRVVAALADFGYPAYRAQVKAFTERDRLVRLGNPPHRVDVLTSISGVASFGAAWKARVRGQFEGVAVAFLGREDFVRNKRAANRPKDLADIALLDEAEGENDA